MANDKNNGFFREHLGRTGRNLVNGAGSGAQATAHVAKSAGRAGVATAAVAGGAGVLTLEGGTAVFKKTAPVIVPLAAIVATVFSFKKIKAWWKNRKLNNEIAGINAQAAAQEAENARYSSGGIAPAREGLPDGFNHLYQGGHVRAEDARRGNQPNINSTPHLTSP